MKLSKSRLKVIDGILSATVVLLSCRILTEVGASIGKIEQAERDLGSLGMISTEPAAVLFLMISLLHVVWIFSERFPGRLPKIKEALLAVGNLAASLFILGMENPMYGVYIALWCLAIEQLSNRIFTIRSRRGVRSVLFQSVLSLCVLIVLLFSFLLSSDFTGEMMLLTVLYLIKTLGHVMALSFSRFKTDALLKIIRETYGAEVLFGLLLLIFTFSAIFYNLEPSMKSYEDALWYSFAIVTTIGFGDFTVTDTFSRFLSVILGIYGIVVVSMITSIIVNFYTEVTRDKVSDAADPKEQETHKENQNQEE